VPIEILDTAIPAVKLIVPSRISDPRGFFVETYRRDAFLAAGLTLDFVQENYSLSIQRHTVRGLHFQTPPFAQDKLIWVLRGRIFDVAVDLRRSSPTFGQHVHFELSSDNSRQLLVPIGFAHGFCTLEPNTEVVYKVTNYYSRVHDCGVAWDDSDIKIKWPIKKAEAMLSDKDKVQPLLSELGPAFD